MNTRHVPSISSSSFRFCRRLLSDGGVIAGGRATGAKTTGRRRLPDAASAAASSSVATQSRRSFSSPSPSPSTPRFVPTSDGGADVAAARPPRTTTVNSAPTAATSTASATGAFKGKTKGLLDRLWDEYSPDGQRKRIVLGERLFRAAQLRANDPAWYAEGRVPDDFRGRHSVLTMHVWFMHRRLLADAVDPHAALLVQEEMFDILWNDTRSRIRAENISEMTVNKHLKNVQVITFEHCTHYDHAFHEYATDAKARFEELCLAIWAHVLRKDEEFSEDHVRRIGAYVEYQYQNVANEMPDEYFWEGRIPWGNVPDFKGMVDNDGKPLAPLDYVDGDGESKNMGAGAKLPPSWVPTLTDAGETYYWNMCTNETRWDRPKN